jgi:hypothetical protein
MTPAEFSALGRMAWGAAWQRPMAAALGVSLDSVRSMSIGRAPIRDNVKPQIRRAVVARATELFDAAKKLPVTANTR